MLLDRLSPCCRRGITATRHATRLWSHYALALLLLGGLCLLTREATITNLSSPSQSLSQKTEEVAEGVTEPNNKDHTTLKLEMMRSELFRGPEAGTVLPACPFTPPGLFGKLYVEEHVEESEVERRLSVSEGGEGGVQKGGRWWPQECQARWSVAILVPYRDRSSQIGPFLNHMHPFLQRQQLNYSIYFIEQAGSKLFNRARLLNVGFLEAVKDGPWDCYAFHDIDMLPENDHHLYHCSLQPRHLAVARNINKYKDAAVLPYNTYYGGACLMKEDHVRRVNGWSNIYWGWGSEDDDMWLRIKQADMRVWRYPPQIARYKMIKHKQQPRNEKRFELLKSNTGRYPKEGLNSLHYNATKTLRPLYTHLLAHIDL